MRAVKDGHLTEREAAALLGRFDAGELEIPEDETPLDLSEAIRPVTDEDVARDIAALLALGSLAYLHLRRARFREVLQDGFIERAKGLARARAAGKVMLPAWQTRMGDEIRSHVVKQVAVGSGRAPRAAAVTGAVRVQQAYLSGWADYQAVRFLQDNPMSELAMMARAALYAGAGRAEGYRAEAELHLEGGAVTYTAVDDEGTCAECLDAEGAYSVSEPFPVPGSVCRGYGNCRCTLSFSEVAA